MSELLSVVFASGNAGKLAEMRALLQGLPIQVLTQKDVLGRTLEIDETGATFAENAAIKARAVAQATQLVALADDSGLEVDALGGRPGVYSARYAGEHANDAANNALRLRELAPTPTTERSARFRCVLAIVTPWDDAPLFADGTCEGQIALAPRGTDGFGYDPLFLPSETPGRTLAELTLAEKNALSHRAAAVRNLRPILLDWLNRQLDRAERLLG